MITTYDGDSSNKFNLVLALAFLFKYILNTINDELTLDEMATRNDKPIKTGIKSRL